MVMTALLANTAVNPANTTGNGLLFGETALFTVHMIGMAIVIIYTLVGSMLILRITNWLSPLTISDDEKNAGSDVSQHGENADFRYDLAEAS
jgi:ammonium transporter, Amt family